MAWSKRVKFAAVGLTALSLTGCDVISSVAALDPEAGFARYEAAHSLLLTLNIMQDIPDDRIDAVEWIRHHVEANLVMANFADYSRVDWSGSRGMQIRSICFVYTAYVLHHGPFAQHFAEYEPEVILAEPMKDLIEQINAGAGERYRCAVE